MKIIRYTKNYRLHIVRKILKKNQPKRYCINEGPARESVLDPSPRPGLESDKKYEKTVRKKFFFNIKYEKTAMKKSFFCKRFFTSDRHVKRRQNQKVNIFFSEKKPIWKPTHN